MNDSQQQRSHRTPPGPTEGGLVRLAAHERQLAALNLRKAGATYEDIARQLKYRDHTGAWVAVRRALHRTLKEPADEVRNLELARLDEMLLAIWQNVRAGNLTAIDRALRIMDRRARYLGLDAPIKEEYEPYIRAEAARLNLDADEMVQLADEWTKRNGAKG